MNKNKILICIRCGAPIERILDNKDHNLPQCDSCMAAPLVSSEKSPKSSKK